MDDFEGPVKIVSSMTLKNRKNDGISTFLQIGTTGLKSMGKERDYKPDLAPYFSSRLMLFPPI